MGSIKLSCTPESVQLDRLSRGLLALAIDHDVTRLMGRIVSATVGGGRVEMIAEVGDTPTALRALDESDQGMRRGFSPGFLINSTAPLPKEDPDYDSKAFAQVLITSWEAYEVSSSAIPRSIDAVLTASMNDGGMMNTNGSGTAGMEAPALVSIDNMVELGVVTLRMALNSGQGTEEQRVKMTLFFETYDALVGRGEAEEVAAEAAKRAAGI